MSKTEQQAAADAATHAPEHVSGGLSNVADVNSATKLRDQVAAWGEQLRSLAASDSQNYSPSFWQANQYSEQEITNYIAVAGEQGTAVGEFQQQYQQLLVDYSRLDGAIRSFAASDAGASLEGPAPKNGTEFANAVEHATGVTDADKARLQNPNLKGDEKVGQSSFDRKKDEVQKLHDAAMEAANDVTNAQGDTMKEHHNVDAAVADIDAGLEPREKPELDAETRELKATLATARSIVKSGLDKVLTMISVEMPLLEGMSATAELLPGAATAKVEAKKLGEEGTKVAKDLSSEAIAELIEIPFKAQIDLAESKVKSEEIRQVWNAKKVQTEKLKSASQALGNAASKFAQAIHRLRQKKVELRTAIEELGKYADALNKGDSHSICAKLLADGDAFLAQAVVVERMGKVEQAKAKEATAARHGVEDKPKDKGGRYYEVGPFEKHPVSGQSIARIIYHDVNFEYPGKQTAYGEQGANATIDTLLEDLATKEKFIQDMTKQLAAQFGLNF
jgi:hypothetical protein